MLRTYDPTRWTRLLLLLSWLTLALVACGDDGGGGGTDLGATDVVSADIPSPTGDTVASDVAPADTPGTDSGPPDAGSGEDGAAPGPDVRDAAGPADTEAPDGAADTGPPPDVDPNDPGPPPPHQREAAPTATGALRAGAAVGFVTGPVGISMAGYGGRSGLGTPWSELLKGSQGFYGYQTVKAIALEVDGERLVLMKLPTMSSESSLTDGIADKLADRYGIDLRGRILTGATHSHHTNARYWRLPAALGVVGIDSVDEEVIDQLTSTFAETVKRAIDDLGPAEWAYGYLNDWDPDDRVYADRRWENDSLGYGKDPRLTLLAVRRPDGTPMATLINFGMHGTAFGGDNDLLTEDAPGAIELKFEERFREHTGQPILGLFIQSGGGDATPAGAPLGHPTPQRIELIGEEAAPRILALYDTLEWRSEASLAVRSRRIDLRWKWFGYEADPEFTYPNGYPYYWGAWQCTSPDVEPGESMEGHPKQCNDLRGLLLAFGAGLPNGEIHQMYLSVARIGPLFLMTIPGEPAYSVVKYAREQIATRTDDGAPIDVLVYGYSQDHFLYFTHRDDWFMGGYESEMSLWGPLAGKYVVDRQMELVDDLLAGYPRPVWYEESPNLSLPKPFEPRAFERSVDPGQVTTPVAAAFERTQNVRFGFAGGDPSVSSPHVVLEAEQPDGSFAPVPSPSGWPGAVFDNSRYHMITHYAPDPPPSRTIRAERRHLWHVDMEVPADLPAGTYRLHATGRYWDGAAEQDYDVVSTPFTVAQAAGAALTATRDAGVVALQLTLPPTTRTREGESSWFVTGWRLFDPTVGPDARITVRAPLAVSVDVDGVARDDVWTVTWDEALGAHRFDTAAAGLAADAALTVHAWLAADDVPSAVSAAVTD